jgi:hypothetical protein
MRAESHPASRAPVASGRAALVFCAAVAAAAAYVWWSAGRLPAVVAVHFGPSGAADGFMPRHGYIGFMLAVVVGVPAFLYLIGALGRRLPVRMIQVPHRQYWLAPERRAATLASFGRFGAWAAYATLALLCVVHGLVVRANAAQPPHLEQAPLVGAITLYMLALFIGMALVLARFFRAP